MIADDIIFQTHQELGILLKKESKLMHFFKQSFSGRKAWYEPRANNHSQ